MLRPFLFIGVGGSGGKTLRALKQTLERRLKQYDWNSGIPGAWQFIQVDTAYDGVDFPAPMLPLEDFVGMVGPGQSYDQMVTAIEARLQAPADRQKALAGWLQPRSAVPIATGAGMVRTIGRAVSAAGLASLRDGLRGAIDRLQAPDNMSDLVELSKLLHPKSGGGGQMLDPAVVIVSSIAGGSGAGMFMDISETLKSLAAGKDGWLRKPMAYLYTPEVFDSIPVSMRAQIPMNALGAMNEILAGLWAEEASEATNVLFNASGVEVIRPKEKGAVGPAGVYLIGSRNANGVNISKGADGAGMDEVFLAVGEALAGLITDEDLSNNYNAYFYTNVFPNSGKEVVLADHTGLRRPSDTMERMPFAGLGFARVTLGMDRLMDYGSEGLTKEHVHTMLFPEFEPVDPLNPIQDAEHIERAVIAQLDDFVDGSRLNERQPHDQVVNFLRGDDTNGPAWDPAPGTQQEVGQARKRSAQDYARNCVPVAAQNPNATFSAAQWQTMLLQQAATLLPRFLADQRSETEARAREWTEEIQTHLVEYTAKWISRSGFRVTADLLRRLRDDLQQVATQEMPHEAEEMRSRGKDFDAAVAGRLGAGSNLGSNSPEVGQALQALQIGAERLSEAQLLEYVPALLKNVTKSVLTPLIEECDVAHMLLSQEVNPSGNGRSGRLFKQFANLKEDRANGWVAPRYKPRQVERMLIEANEFPSEFERIQKMDLMEEDKSNWASITAAWSLQGIPLRARDKRVNVEGSQTLIEVLTRWVPEEQHARRDSSLGPQSLEVRFPHTIDELVNRNRKWLEDGDSYFGRQYRMSIADYCNGGSKRDQAVRQQVFISAFTDLIQLSAPLIGINSDAIQAFHHNPNPALTPHGTQLHVTAIPFAEQSAVGQECVAILQRDGQDPSQFAFDAASTAKDLFGFALLKSAMSPMVFTSLIEPIANSWLTSSTNAKARQSFWDGRRARPLVDSLPMPPEIRLSMIVGWYMSYIFGERRKDKSNNEAGVKWEIWGPEDGWMSFPHPLLPVSPLDRSPLPAILKSLSLAIVEAGKLASPAPLAPYMRLKLLGREVTADHRFGRDIQDLDAGDKSNLMSAWVHSRSLPDGAPQPELLHKIGSDTDLTSATNRKEIVIKACQDLIDQYQKIWTSFAKTDWRDTPRIVELQDDIDTALTLLLQYAEMLTDQDESLYEDL